jgi:hypothetical protein
LSAFDKLVHKAIVVPTVVLIGMYISGALVGSFLNMPNQFGAIFAGAGGVAMLAAYFKGFFK